MGQNGGILYNHGENRVLITRILKWALSFGTRFQTTRGNDTADKNGEMYDYLCLGNSDLDAWGTSVWSAFRNYSTHTRSNSSDVFDDPHTARPEVVVECAVKRCEAKSHVGRSRGCRA